MQNTILYKCDILYTLPCIFLFMLLLKQLESSNYHCYDYVNTRIAKNELKYEIIYELVKVIGA